MQIEFHHLLLAHLITIAHLPIFTIVAGTYIQTEGARAFAKASLGPITRLGTSTLL